MHDVPDLPPLDLLPTFALAARLGSFKAAAEALHLSPSAVSQQIKALEEALGVPLFIRAVRCTRLSPEGERFLSAVRPALTDIGAAVGALRRRALSRVLRVSTVPSVAHEVLIPHLHTFSIAEGWLSFETGVLNRDDYEGDQLDFDGVNVWDYYFNNKPRVGASWSPFLQTLLCHNCLAQQTTN